MMELGDFLIKEIGSKKYNYISKLEKVQEFEILEEVLMVKSSEGVMYIPKESLEHAVYYKNDYQRDLKEIRIKRSVKVVPKEEKSMYIDFVKGLYIKNGLLVVENVDSFEIFKLDKLMYFTERE